MITDLLENTLHLIIILPIVFMFLKNRNKENYYKIVIFIFVFLAYEFIIKLPWHFELFNFIHSKWNWDGKLMGVLFGLISFMLFKKQFQNYNYFTLKQDKENKNKVFWVSGGVVVLATIIWYIFGKTDFNIETLAFNLILPGIDEEIIFRGILLGLLMSILKENVLSIINPSVLITSILFGFIHALKLNSHNSINFDTIYFFQTGLAGYAWGWITVKSKSILFAILSHNFSNFFGTLITMIK